MTALEVIKCLKQIEKQEYDNISGSCSIGKFSYLVYLLNYSVDYCHKRIVLQWFQYIELQRPSASRREREKDYTNIFGSCRKGRYSCLVYLQLGLLPQEYSTEVLRVF